MTEREWYEFSDALREGVSWKVDVTFLLSHWRCIYGRGCKSTLPEPNTVEGCCSYGAYFADDADKKRVRRAAARLKPEQWQLHPAGARAGIGKKKTRVVAGACIFLNRGGFRGGTGCALHIGAVQAGESPIDWKPDVCWQLPLRYREEDGGLHVIEEFSRATWGEGGKEFGWWCTEAPEAFTARRRVYRTLEPELRRIMSDASYETLARYLDQKVRSAIVHSTEQVTIGRRART